MKKNKLKLEVSRRGLLKSSGLSLIGLPFVNLLESSAHAQTGNRKLLQIFLRGGWDSILATDPASNNNLHPALMYAKSQAGNGYQAEYYTPGAGNPIVDPATPVPGKSNLFVGEGLKNALSAFTSVPTAFVNGMFVEVTAHELAEAYLLSGRLSLSRSREYPAFVATMGDKVGGFPAHVVLGAGIPLGDTRDSNPPLQSQDAGLFNYMLAGPRMKEQASDIILTDPSLNAANTLIDQLNGTFSAKLGQKAKDGFQPWTNSESFLGGFYDSRFDQNIALVDGGANGNIVTRYGVQVGNYNSMEARLATAYMSLAHGLSRFVTINFDGFDTHQGHLGAQLPLQQNFANRLVTLINDLTTTDDPDDPTKKLSETTTVLITSEFNRTPLFNGNAGTDHWQTGSAIVMCAGVNDNTVIGGTDERGAALGWNGGIEAMASGNTNALYPEHLAATILRQLGFNTEADDLSTVNVGGLFV